MLCNFARVSCGKLRKRKLGLQSEEMLQTITHLQPKAAQVHRFVLSYQLSDLPLFGWPISPATLEHCRTIKNPAVLHSYTGHGKHKLPGCCLNRIAISPWISIMFWHGISTATPGFFPRTTDSQPLTTKIHHLR